MGCFNQELFKAVISHDRVYIAGGASSHCVKSTIEDLARNILAFKPELLQNIYILEDCMSSVPATPGSPDFPDIADKALQKIARLGIKVVKSENINENIRIF